MAQDLLAQLYSDTLHPGQQHQQLDRQLVQSELPLHWQAPYLALLRTAQHSTDTPAAVTEYLLACNSAVRMAGLAVHHCLRLQHFVRGYGLSAVQMGPALVIDEDGVRAPMPALYADSVMPQRSQIMSQLLQLQRAPQRNDSQDQGSAGSQAEGFGTFGDALGSTACLLHHLAQHCIQPQPQQPMGIAAQALFAADSTTAAAAADVEKANVAGQLCALFDNLVRCQAESSSSSSSSGLADTQVRAMFGLPGLLHGEVPGWGAGPLVDPVAQLADLSSPQALQLFGLLCSMLKAASDTRLQQQLNSVDPSGNSIGSTGGIFVRAVCISVTEILRGAKRDSATAAPASRQEVEALRPWLMLLGRCALFLGSELRRLCAAQPSPAQAAFNSMFGVWLGGRDCVIFVDSMCKVFDPAAQLVCGFLQDSSIAAHLGAIGYGDLHSLSQQLQSVLLAAQRTLLFSPTDGPSTAAFQDLAGQLSAVGNVLSAFANPRACNNSGCSNVAGPSEAQLVTGNSSVCGGCRTARYCSKVCQAKHWKQHKPVCKALAAAAAKASTGPATAGTCSAVSGPSNA